MKNKEILEICKSALRYLHPEKNTKEEIVVISDDTVVMKYNDNGNYIDELGHVFDKGNPLKLLKGEAGIIFLEILIN